MKKIEKYFLINPYNNEDGFEEIEKDVAITLVNLGYTIISYDFDEKGNNLLTGYGDLLRNLKHTGSMFKSIKL